MAASTTPISHGPTDLPVRDLWLPVTIQVAWTFLQRGIAISPSALQDAREHVLRSISPGMTIDVAEWLTPEWTEDFLKRRLDSVYNAPPRIGPEVDVPAEDWRDALIDGLDNAELATFRLHYAEGLSMEVAAKHLRCPVGFLQDARERLRTKLKAVVGQHEVWRNEYRQLDTLLKRLANLAHPGGPGPLGLMSPAGLAHAEQCPRTSRAVRLLRARHLTPQDLFAPSASQSPASSSVDLIALLVHPDARNTWREIDALVGTQGCRAGDGIWLVSGDAEAAVYEGLVELCTAGHPARHHVRAARSTGNGRWSGQTVLGPIATQAVDRARARPWGDVCGRAPLPLPAPPPPSARGWWAGALAVSAAVVCLGVVMARPALPTSPTPIQAQFHHSIDGWDVTFDLPDDAVLDVVSIQGRDIRILHRNVRSARGAWANGFGQFRARLRGDNIALIASPKGIENLEQYAVEALQQPYPLVAFKQRVLTAAPRADFVHSQNDGALAAGSGSIDASVAEPGLAPPTVSASPVAPL